MSQKATKRYGQHFLESSIIAQRMVQLAAVDKGDYVLEVGPGRGALTRLLLQTGANVLAIEIDSHLIPVLTAQFAGYRNLHLICADVLKCDLESLLRTSEPGIAWKMISNLPYNEATAILQHFIDFAPVLCSMTVMVQREVADRLLAKPGNRQIGYLTHLLGCHFQIQRGFPVRPGCFRPPPKVHSTVLQLLPHQETHDLSHYGLFKQLLHHGFAHRRKTLINALKPLCREESVLNSLIKRRGLEPQVRAEALSCEDFLWLAGELLHLQQKTGLLNPHVID